MTDDARDRRPDVDGGPDHGDLFERFPDPVLAYATETEPGRGAGTPVAREVNPAFETRFDVDGEAAAGRPLAEFALAGARVGDVDTGDGASATDDEAGVDERAAEDTGTGEVTGDEDGGGCAETVEGAADPVDRDAGPTVDPGPLDAASLLERVRRDDAPVWLRHASDGEIRHFQVRAVHGEDDASEAGTASGASDDGEGGYLLFVDVTDLERRRRDLETAVARLERLGSVVRHDLRNPLEVASIRLEAARDTGEDVHFEKVAGALDRIEHIARDALAVGPDALDPTETVALDAVAESAWETVDTPDATLVVETGLPTVRGDADRLRQLFENLFRNCVEHGSTSSRPAADDSVEHGSTGSRPSVGDGERDDGDNDRGVTVTVAPLPDGFVVVDDGPGLTREASERAFEAGYSTEPDNSGLGLSIVDQIARGHGWRVSLGSDGGRSAEGDGARFEFTGVERVGSEDGVGETGGDGPDRGRGPD